MLDNTCVITFANTEIHKEYQKEFHDLYGSEFEKIIDYNELFIKATGFYKENMQMFQYDKYFGYFLWKPFLIDYTFQTMPQQYVLYCDSNLRFTNFRAFEADFKQQMARQGMYLVKHQNFTNKDWTKRDAFILMQSDNERYWNAHQFWTPLLGFSRATIPQTLLYDYLAYCKIPQIVTELPNEFGENLPGFREHRWEQSVLSILVEKYGLTGTPDTEVIRWVTKLYSDELLRFKDKINAQPLSKSV